MFLTNKARYAVMAVSQIASNNNSTLVKLADIASMQQIELKFLEQIFAKLKKNGLVEAVRGPNGGYRMLKSANNITVAEIISAVEEKIKITRCQKDAGGCAAKTTGMVCVAHDVWTKLEHKIDDYLSSITIHDMQHQHHLKNSKSNDIYFDNNATTPLLTEVKEEMYKLYGKPLNASSIHANGRLAKSYLEYARNKVKEMVNADDDYHVVFTSSGTEANNLAILGVHEALTLISVIEHHSILSLVPQALITVLRNGVVDLDAFAVLLNRTHKTSKRLVSVMMANNETGVIQPIKRVVELARAQENTVLVHTDAVQCAGKIEINIKELGVDMMTISAHKFGGPIGAAALIFRKELNLNPIIKGGGQEYRFRAGSHNIQAIHGFGIACTVEGKYRMMMDKTSFMRDYIEREIINISNNQAIIFGKDADRLPNTSSISMPNVSAQSQIIYFDMNGIAVSIGSACSSGSVGTASHVQTAMGYSQEEVKNAIRISLGVDSKMTDCEQFVQAWQELYSRSKKLIKKVV